MSIDLKSLMQPQMKMMVEKVERNDQDIQNNIPGAREISYLELLRELGTVIFEKMRDCGELGIELGEIRGSGSRVSRDLLKKFLKEFVWRSAKYYEGTGDHVFYYSERQIHSAICPAIANITPTFLMEHPLTRKPAGEEEYRGRTDYWIYYRDYSFVMELKHTYFAYNRAYKPRKGILKKFAKALKDLENVKKDEYENLKVGYGLRRIALEVVVFYRRWREKAELKDDLKRCDFKSLFEELIENTKLERKSNLRALWILDKELAEPVEIKPLDSFEIFPAVAFVGSISKILE